MASGRCEEERGRRRAGDGSVAERWQSTGQTLDAAATLPVDEAADGSEL